MRLGSHPAWGQNTQAEDEDEGHSGITSLVVCSDLVMATSPFVITVHIVKYVSPQTQGPCQCCVLTAAQLVLTHSVLQSMPAAHVGIF